MNILQITWISLALLGAVRSPAQATATSGEPASSRIHSDDHAASDASSTYVELDSWVYPAMERLAAQGVVQYEFLGLRPWTRRAIYHMLATAAPASQPSEELLRAIKKELFREVAGGSDAPAKNILVESIYQRTQFISGTPLNDSYHFGQTIANDFGRTYGHGWQQIGGFETRAEHGRFSVFVRGEYQHSPSVPGYNADMANIIAVQDDNPTRSYPNRVAEETFRLLDTYASVEFLGQQFSFGKQSYWWGPDSNAMMLSNNAEPFYSFRIDRTLPLRIPLLSKLLGPIRYDNFFGKLSGHLYPRQPYFYGQKINFSPTSNLELGFARDAVIAGDGSTPLTFGTFWQSFTSTSSETNATSVRNALGARHGSFDFRYRLPGVRNWLTLYADSLVHDDISPVDAPRHAATTAGIYLSRFPLIPKLDLHIEGGSSDITPRAEGGKYYYYEGIYRDCYLNKGNLMGSRLGREGTGGQAWSTYWINAHSTLEVGYRTLRVSPHFVPQGESQQAGYGELRYRWQDGMALEFLLQAERWNAPALAAGPQTDVTTQVQVSFNPRSWKLPIRQQLAAGNSLLDGR